jgi:hypothetical protein
MNKSTSSQILQTKDQGPDPIQFLCNKQIDFFSNLADQRASTRSNGYGVMIGSHEQERTKDFFAVSVNESREPSTKDQTEAGEERSLLQHFLKQSNND